MSDPMSIDPGDVLRVLRGISAIDTNVRALHWHVEGEPGMHKIVVEISLGPGEADFIEGMRQLLAPDAAHSSVRLDAEQVRLSMDNT